MKQTDHMNRWRDVIRGEKKEVDDATAVAAREEPADEELSRDVDGAQSGSEQQVDGDAEREMGREERGGDLPLSLGDGLADVVSATDSTIPGSWDDDVNEDGEMEELESDDSGPVELIDVTDAVLTPQVQKRLSKFVEMNISNAMNNRRSPPGLWRGGDARTFDRRKRATA